MQPIRTMRGKGILTNQDGKEAHVLYQVSEYQDRTHIDSSSPAITTRHGTITPVSNNDRNILVELYAKRRNSTLTLRLDDGGCLQVLFNNPAPTSDRSFPIIGNGRVTYPEA